MKPIQFSFQLNAPKESVKVPIFKPEVIVEQAQPVKYSDKIVVNPQLEKDNSQEIGAITDDIIRERESIRICTICRRKFKNESHLKYHFDRSKLHKANALLEKNINIKHCYLFYISAYKHLRYMYFVVISLDTINIITPEDH